MTASCSDKLGLVIEGGGVRGIYAAGVLDVLHDLQLPLSGVIGVSAGAVHGCSFVSGQKEVCASTSASAGIRGFSA